MTLTLNLSCLAVRTFGARNFIELFESSESSLQIYAGIGQKAVQPAPKAAICEGTVSTRFLPIHSCIAGGNSYDCSDNVELLSRLAHNQ
jgi:hypothetical protein